MTLGLSGAEIRVAGIDRDREPLEALAASASEQSRAADLLTIQTDLSGSLRGLRDHKSYARSARQPPPPRQKRRDLSQFRSGRSTRPAEQWQPFLMSLAVIGEPSPLRGRFSHDFVDPVT
jgi:hypothetical protein